MGFGDGRIPEVLAKLNKTDDRLEQFSCAAEFSAAQPRWDVAGFYPGATS